MCSMVKRMDTRYKIWKKCIIVGNDKISNTVYGLVHTRRRTEKQKREKSLVVFLQSNYEWKIFRGFYIIHKVGIFENRRLRNGY